MSSSNQSFGATADPFDKPEPSVNNTSLGLGIALTVVAAVAGWFAWGYLENIVGAVIAAVISLYFLGAIATFWLAELWKDGVTKGEVFVLVLWPWKVWQILKSTNLTEAFRSLSLGDDGVANVNNGVIDNEDDAKGLGLILSAFVGITFGVIFLVAVLSAGFDGLRALVLLQVVSAAGYYWVRGFHRREPSFGMVVEIVAWQFDLFRDLWNKVKVIKLAWKNRTTGNTAV